MKIVVFDEEYLNVTGCQEFYKRYDLDTKTLGIEVKFPGEIDNKFFVEGDIDVFKNWLGDYQTYWIGKWEKIN